MQNTPVSLFLSSLSRKALWILDIDSTLVLTHKRNQVILHRFAQEFRDSYPDFCSKLAQAECHAFEYGYSKALERASIATDTAPCEALAKFWRQHFFSNDFLHHDLIHKGATELVQALRKNNLPFVYLTGRPRPLMQEGTLRVLKQFGFYVTEDNLFLKTRTEDKDELFKSLQVSEFKKQYSEIVFLDNEPKVLNQIDKDHPDIPLIFMDTCHSPNVVAPQKSLTVKTFDDILLALK